MWSQTASGGWFIPSHVLFVRFCSVLHAAGIWTGCLSDLCADSNSGEIKESSATRIASYSSLILSSESWHVGCVLNMGCWELGGVSLYSWLISHFFLHLWIAGSFQFDFVDFEICRFHSSVHLSFWFLPLFCLLWPWIFSDIISQSECLLWLECFTLFFRKIQLIHHHIFIWSEKGSNIKAKKEE